METQAGRYFPDWWPTSEERVYSLFYMLPVLWLTIENPSYYYWPVSALGAPERVRTAYFAGRVGQGKLLTGAVDDRAEIKLPKSVVVRSP